MTALVVDGQAIAAQVLEGVRDRAARLAEQSTRPCLAYVMTGSSRPAELYASGLERIAARVGIQVVRHVLPESATASDLEQEVSTLSADVQTDGILVQMPLPEHLISARLYVLIDPRKDVDGITVQNAGCLYLGHPGQTPSTAAAMLQILDSIGVEVRGKHAVVIGRSRVVGRPVAELLLQKDATVTVTHRQTHDLGRLTRQAEILMVAAGQSGVVTADMVSPGVVVIDAGINVTDHGVVGDVDFEACKHVAAAITPVPGGVGPVTNAVLMQHVVSSAEQRHG